MTSKDSADLGWRCPRNCVNCPLCTSRLVLIPTFEGEEEHSEAPYIQKCEYCMWTSLDCGLKYPFKNDLRRELDKFSKKVDRKPVLDELAQGYLKSKLSRKPLPKDPALETKEENTVETSQEQIADPLTRFHALKNFYKSQLKVETENDDLTSPFGTPRSHLSRLASIYNIPLNKKSESSAQQANQPMREAIHPSEGLFLPPSPSGEITRLSQRPEDTYHTTVSEQQHHYQHAGSSSGSLTGRTTSSLLPMPTLLNTVRSKRCAECKHILVKHEQKIDSARYRIRLVAISYIPLVTLRPFTLSPSPAATAQTTTAPTLPPNQPTQYLLTLRNHIFERIRVRLGTPATTPGPHPHRVTILCPEFEVGANTEVWDASVDPSATAAAVTGPGLTTESGLGGTREVVAGKVYESGRNWTSVVVEIVATIATVPPTEMGKGESGNENGDEEVEDADVVEIPIRVSLEWRMSDEEQLKQRRAMVDEDDTGERELGYWMVLGVGRVGR